MNAQPPGAIFLAYLQQNLSNEWAARAVQQRLHQWGREETDVLQHLDALLWAFQPAE